MIFTNTVTTVQNQIVQNAQLIDTLQARSWRTKTTESNSGDAFTSTLPTAEASFGSAESASQSAVEQVKIAVGMISAIDQSQLSVLKEVIDNVFNEISEPTIKLLSAIDIEPDKSQTRPTSPIPSDDNQESYTEVLEVSQTDNSSDNRSLTKLKKLTVTELKELCTKYGISEWVLRHCH